MPPPLSAVDSIAPAIEQTKRLLFKPFRSGRFFRLAVVCLVTGEFAGGGGGGGTNFNVPADKGKSGGENLWLAASPWESLQEYLPWIVLGIAVLLALLLLWVYAGSIFRFVLLESVVYDRCELREGWRRWQAQGGSYFQWLIGFALTFFAAMALLIGGPILAAWRAGIFRHPKDHLVLLIVGGALLFFLLMGLFFLGALISLFAKDFVIPIMALERVGVMDGWRRLTPMIRAEKMAYVIYVLMKIVLAVGSAILFGIASLLALAAVLIPLAIAGILIFVIAKLAGVGWNPVTMAMTILLGMVVVLGILYVVALVSTPAMVFFQCYTLRFFGSRYLTLGALLLPPTPAPSAPRGPFLSAPAPVP